MDYVLLQVIRATFFCLRLLPDSIRLSLLHKLFQLAALLLPRYKKIAYQNLRIAFPELSPQEHSDLFAKSLYELGRLLSDIIRIENVDSEWVEKHVTIQNDAAYRTLQSKQNGKGILIATGHLGSFEILARSAALKGFPLSFVARNFTLPAVDDWWKAQRNRYGNEMIDRTGAYKKVVDRIRGGRDVALLIDQNVTRNRAVFVDFFGHPAATTKALALAALQNETAVVVASVEYLGSDNYEMLWEKVETDDIYGNDSLNRAEKVHAITARASKIYEEMIRRSPESWFWMHRRWKTRPLETDKNLYSS